jgi:triosephosphate isomerase
MQMLAAALALASSHAFAPRSSTVRAPSTRLSSSVWYDAQPQRRALIAGNWKLNPSTAQDADALLALLASNVRTMATPPEIVIFPPTPFLQKALEAVDGTGIAVGAQDISLEESGAFTGEVAASMVRSLGCDWALVGHSERRTLYDEGDDVCNQKVLRCLAQDGLKVILCVGETLEEYESDLLETIVSLQVRKGLAGVDVADADRIAIAYEPVWAIGTGKVATPEQAQAAHVAVRRALSEVLGAEAARRVRVQYGGSVTPESIDRLMAQPDVDGALVGGASLVAEKFSRICEFSAPTTPETTPPREITARVAVACANALGESPIWSQRDNTLYWVSAVEGELWRWNCEDAPYKIIPRFGTTLGFVAARAGGGLLLGGEDAILSLDETAREAVVLAAPPAEGNTRPNDGRVDRDGRMVMGMYNNYHRAGASQGEDNSGLYRFGADFDYEELLDYKFRVSNCCCFPADGRTVYFADTPTRKIYAFDYPKSGKPENRRLIWTQPPHWPGGPDGAQCDADGMIWVALNGAGRVVRIDPATGAIDLVVHTPGCPTPTSCTFGGPDLDELFITTAARPAGGQLFRAKMPFGIKGLPEPEWQGGD